MRHSFRIAVVTLVVSSLGASVAHADGYGGFRAGVNHAYLSGDTEELGLTGSREVFTGGIFLGFDTDGMFGFRTDLLYTMKGAKDDFGTELKVDYFEMAPLLVARFPLGSRFAVRGFVGPVFGAFVNAELDGGPVDIDLGDIVEHMEISGTLGAEVNYKVGPYVLLLDTRYTTGSQIFEGEDLAGNPIVDEFGNLINVSNVGIAVMLGLMVPF